MCRDTIEFQFKLPVEGKDLNGNLYSKESYISYLDKWVEGESTLPLTVNVNELRLQIGIIKSLKIEGDYLIASGVYLSGGTIESGEFDSNQIFIADNIVAFSINSGMPVSV